MSNVISRRFEFQVRSTACLHSLWHSQALPVQTAAQCICTRTVIVMMCFRRPLCLRPLTHAHVLSSQADAFAVSLGHSSKLTEALLRLEKENKSVLNVDEWYSSFHYSHPPLVERMRAIELRGVDLDGAGGGKKGN